MVSDTNNTDKPALRRALREQRSAIDPIARDRASRAIVPLLIDLPFWQSASVIAAYRATPEEISLLPLTTAATQAGKTVVYPRALHSGEMHFHRLDENTASERGPGGIEQPTVEAPMVEPAAIDIILVPLLACDDRGYRLGYGGGFYDRYLPRTSAKRVGVGFAQQRRECLPAESHDERLDCFVSEAGVVLFP